MVTRGVRGATVSKANTKSDILEATDALLKEMMTQNQIQIPEIASVFFSVTADLDAVFPAIAARQLGLTNTPLLCLNEIDVPNSLGHCVRILMHVNTQKSQAEIQHVYLGEAQSLRPELGSQAES